MGISANQARLMTLTARQHDLELRAQQISAGKMITSLESQQLAMEYSQKLNEYSLLKSDPQAMAEKMVDKAWIDGTYQYNVNPQTGEVTVRPPQLSGTGLGTVGVGTSTPTLTSKEAITSLVLNALSNMDADTFLAEAKAEYDAAVASLSSQEKLLDMELTQLNTEHSAVKTEYDSVKGLVSENTDKSFNVFS